MNLKECDFVKLTQAK